MNSIYPLRKKKKRGKKEGRKESDLHDYRAITGKCLYLCYKPPKAILPNENLEIYDVIFIKVVHPTYFSNLQCTIMGLHIYAAPPPPALQILVHIVQIHRCLDFCNT